MKIFIIHSSGMYKQALEHAEQLENKGYTTYVPLRDTEQVHTTEKGILNSNLNGMRDIDECHVIWDLSSLGVVFDMGMAFALEIPIKIIKTKTHHWTKFVVKREGEYLV